MKSISVFLFAFCLSLFAGCQKADNSITPDHHIFVQGNWQGTLNGTNIVITFIEGEFENGPTITGSAYLSPGGAYSIMSGTHNRVDAVWFALYKIPISTKEAFHLQGTVSTGKIEGTFTQFDQEGKQIATGNWQAQRIP